MTIRQSMANRNVRSDTRAIGLMRECSVGRMMDWSIDDSPASQQAAYHFRRGRSEIRKTCQGNVSKLTSSRNGRGDESLYGIRSRYTGSSREGRSSSLRNRVSKEVGASASSTSAPTSNWLLPLAQEEKKTDRQTNKQTIRTYRDSQ